MPAGNAHLRTPLNIALSDFAQSKAQDEIFKTGRCLPCTVTAVTGYIVTVNFNVVSNFTFPPNVKMPIAAWRYILPPVQIGDKGFAIPGDVYLGGVSGLGGGNADLTQQSNLANLVFFPITSATWVPVDSKAVVIQGVSPSGVVLKSGNGSSSITINDNSITIVSNGSTLSIGSGGIALDGVKWDTHVHLYNPGPGSETETSQPENP